LRIVSLFVNATVTRVRRHHPPMRALGGNLAAKRFTRFALGHCGSCKTTHGTEYGDGEKYLEHGPTFIKVMQRKIASRRWTSRGSVFCP
jgi:hypothetical protein